MSEEYHCHCEGDQLKRQKNFFGEIFFPNIARCSCGCGWWYCIECKYTHESERECLKMEGWRINRK